MQHIEFGKTGLKVSRTAFGALPIQRVSDRKECARILQCAIDGGINFFDTARSYSDSEEKLGETLPAFRKSLVIATKSPALNAKDLRVDVETSLRLLKTDFIDILQFHNPPFVPVPDGADGLYNEALQLQKAGKIRFIGITNHSLERAVAAAKSGFFASVQYPFSLLATEEEENLVKTCAQNGVGYIAMKALAGGLLRDARLAFAYLRQFENVVPIWGIQRVEEIQEILRYEENPPAMDDEMRAKILEERKSLAGNFCRSCGYCMPCPQEIPINQANRMIQLLTRGPEKPWLTPEWLEKMEKIESCTKCGKCAAKCPYHLKPFETMPAHLKYFRERYENAKQIDERAD